MYHYQTHSQIISSKRLTSAERGYLWMRYLRPIHPQRITPGTEIVWPIANCGHDVIEKLHTITGYRCYNPSVRHFQERILQANQEILQRDTCRNPCHWDAFVYLVLIIFLNVFHHGRPIRKFGVTQEVCNCELRLEIVYHKTRYGFEQAYKVQTRVVHVYHPFVQTRQCLDLLVFWSHGLTVVGQERKIVFVSRTQNHGVDFNFAIICQDNGSFLEFLYFRYWFDVMGVDRVFVKVWIPSVTVIYLKE